MKNFTKIFLLSLCIISASIAGAQTEVTYYTSKGNFKAVLTNTKTPRTVDSFLARVAVKFYDRLIFHRVINNFMIQGGDPLGTGMGGPGYYTPDEFDTSLKNVPGALAMANAGANTNGSQFYINLVNNPSLNTHYTVFGMVTTNFTVVQAIGLVATNTSDKPLVDVVIDSIRVTHVHTAAVNNITNTVVATIYPNPARGTFSIGLPGIATKVEILNMLGEVVYYAEATGELKVDLTGQPRGLYIVRAANITGAAENRLILQ
jgi:cyclophilin family peptidyl-prolyl cis-trans isomerase